MNRLKSRKLWVAVLVMAPSILTSFGVDTNLFLAFLSDAQEKVALAAAGSIDNSVDPMVYLVGIVYIWVQGQLDKMPRLNEGTKDAK